MMTYELIYSHKYLIIPLIILCFVVNDWNRLFQSDVISLICQAFKIAVLAIEAFLWCGYIEAYGNLNPFYTMNECLSKVTFKYVLATAGICAFLFCYTTLALDDV
eukprot:TRINITY_DN1274_c1_g1_i4.p1 TRINITY_DN1274_c1_g1~~TRINITY_DN1274_c1_g1_i4.p1  ORF type:complete len:105 (-),score=5.06 TRINITY_DN1274_c1_g1_i4:6-320(-)